MVYGFVKQSGGHVKIYSEVGEGTTSSSISRALDRREHRPGLAREPARKAEPAPRSRRRRKRSCWSRTTSRSIASPARRCAIAATGCSSATEAPPALQLLDAEPTIDLLFTDVVLPGGMNGRQLADEVLRRRPAIKVLFATGYTRNAIIHHGRLDPDVELLTKPYTYDVLARKIRAVLDNVRTAP